MPHTAIDIERDHTLEDLIDRHGLSAVLTALRDIAQAKAEHVRSAWQDAHTARAWERTARAIDKATPAIVRDSPL